MGYMGFHKTWIIYGFHNPSILYYHILPYYITIRPYYHIIFWEDEDLKIHLKFPKLF